MQAEGKVVEMILLDGLPAAYIACPPRLIPPPGGYLLAYMPDSDMALATAVYAAASFAESHKAGNSGFLAAPPIPGPWTLGSRLILRGPLGHGFAIPSSARRVALVAFDSSPRRLLVLLDKAIKMEAAVTLLCESPVDDLPFQVEVQPLRALAEVGRWADYLAIDTMRESLPELRKQLETIGLPKFNGESQVLIRTLMPCGGLAECGVCTVEVRGGPQLACVDGPVFDLRSVVLKT